MAGELAAGAADDGRLRVAVAGGGILVVDALAMAGLALLWIRRRRHRLAVPTV